MLFVLAVVAAWLDLQTIDKKNLNLNLVLPCKAVSLKSATLTVLKFNYIKT